MPRIITALMLVLLMATACGPAAPVATPTAMPASPVTAVVPTSTLVHTLLPTQTLTPTPTSLANYPPQGYGPADFPDDVDPLTGLPVADPSLLDRRPLAIKISNLPREIRPQYGLSLADIVFNYYTEAGGTRFIAVYLGQDAKMVGPIRSARFFDAHIVRGYKAVFAFGSAWIGVLNRLMTSEFANRLVVEDPETPLFRFDPNGANSLMVNTADLSAYATQKGIDNGRQDLNGMLFQLQPPSGGQAVNRIYVRYASESYNRFDYDPASGRYLRFEDSVDDPSNGNAEHYTQLIDQLTGQPVAFDNLVVLYVTNKYYIHPQPGKNEVIDIQFSGLGTGYAFRDGQVYKVNWVRNDTDVFYLTMADGGGHYAFKPGTTDVEIIGVNSNLKQTPQSWRFTHHMP